MIVPLVFFLNEFQSSKKVLKVEDVMERIPHTMLRVHLYLYPVKSSIKW